MGKDKRVAIIGHFGGKENILDGQTIKTKILYDELSNETNWDIYTVDTYYKSKNPVKLVVNTIKSLFTARDIVVLLSGNGMKMYFPLLSFMARFAKKNIYHDVIGGNLDKYVERIPSFKNYLSSFKVNWVETELLKNRLAKQGVMNCEVIPNFKRLNCVKVSDIQPEFSEPYRFCMFSRVMREKGIETAIKAVEDINGTAGRTVCTLDIYGSVDQGYTERFDEIMKSASDAIAYRGRVDYDKSVDAIKDYYALLFPTFWDGEGFPGTIVDAFSAGLPVIATDWNCNSEIIQNGRNGILYPDKDIKDLREAIMWIINNRNLMPDMKKACIATAQMYQPDKYIEHIIEEIGKE